MKNLKQTTLMFFAALGIIAVITAFDNPYENNFDQKSTITIPEVLQDYTKFASIDV